MRPKSHSQWSPIKRCGPAASLKEEGDWKLSLVLIALKRLHSWPPNPRSVFPRARQGKTRHPHCTDGKTEAGRGQWLAQDHTESYPFSAPDPPRPPAEPCPNSSGTSRHSAPCTAPSASLFMPYALMGLFFFHCKSSMLLRTSWRKLRDAKKNLIISPVHLPKSLQDMQKINIKCEVCALSSLFIKTHANVYRRITVCYQKVRPSSSFLLLVFLTKYHQQPSRRTETQWTQAS